jgi:dTDP-4-dehydrorhamnose reductase|tara:strand:+ start:947 stop:1786 length:840 start_codon:yes stop_codon:yes gene_type:complete
MKILITGTNGQVGHALVVALARHEVISLNRQQCNLINLDGIERIIDSHQPDLIINPAAYTKVDQAEDEPELAFKINADAPKLMAKKAREYHIPFIHFSTDFVFDGKKKGAYSESDSTNPLGVYGSSKLAGEEAIQDVGGQAYIFRTSWVYSNIGHNFYLTMKRLSQEKNQLNVVSDQVGVPTSSYFIAAQIQKIIPRLNQAHPGIFHLVPDGYCSWYDFAKEIITKITPEFDIAKIYPIKAENYPSKASRPLNSILENTHIKNAFMLEFKDWQSELKKI